MRGIKEKKPKKMKIRTSWKLDKFFPDFKNFDKIIAEKRKEIKALRERNEAFDDFISMYQGLDDEIKELDSVFKEKQRAVRCKV